MEWPRVKSRSPLEGPSTGVYTNLDDLIRLQFSASGFTLHPRQPLHSVLAGRKASRLRGRGLDFEELRIYRPGDDIRNIDWKATARLRKPQVRVYLEERDRPCILVVDQRGSMFFGSREKTKAVAAAEAAALGAWRVLKQSDRVGAVIFNDTDIKVIRPLRSVTAVTRILREIVRFNRRLGVSTAAPQGREMLTTAIEQTQRMAKHDALVVVLSDFAGNNDTLRPAWSRIAAHNDTLAVHVSDQLERELPRASHLTFQNLDRQIEIDTGSGRLRREFAAAFGTGVEEVRRFLRRVETPILSIDTVGDVSDQIRAQLGEARGRGR